MNNSRITHLRITDLVDGGKPRLVKITKFNTWESLSYEHACELEAAGVVPGSFGKDRAWHTVTAVHAFGPEDDVTAEFVTDGWSAWIELNDEHSQSSIVPARQPDTETAATAPGRVEEPAQIETLLTEALPHATVDLDGDLVHVYRGVGGAALSLTRVTVETGAGGFRVLGAEGQPVAPWTANARLAVAQAAAEMDAAQDEAADPGIYDLPEDFDAGASGAESPDHNEEETIMANRTTNIPNRIQAPPMGCRSPLAVTRPQPTGLPLDARRHVDVAVLEVELAIEDVVRRGSVNGNLLQEALLEARARLEAVYSL